MFKTGDLVVWYDYYDCGTICRDSGVGLIVSEGIVTEHNTYRVLKHDYLIGQYTDQGLEDYAVFSKRQNAFTEENYQGAKTILFKQDNERRIESSRDRDCS